MLPTTDVTSSGPGTRPRAAASSAIAWSTRSLPPPPSVSGNAIAVSPMEVTSAHTLANVASASRSADRMTPVPPIVSAHSRMVVDSAS